MRWVSTSRVVVFQELRLSKAVEVMMQHVENLKLLYEKEHTELEETRWAIPDKLTQDYNRPESVFIHNML